MSNETEILKAYEERTTPLGWFVFCATALIALAIIVRGIWF